MIVQWDSLLDYYGADLSVHREALCKAHQETYAVLACKWSTQEPVRFANRRGEHAEERLLESSVWLKDIPAVLDARSDLDSAPLIVTLAINRSPCGHCSLLLARALEKLQFEFARRFENTVFVLASLGYYQSQKFMKDGTVQEHDVTKKNKWVTTGKGLERVANAGWRLAALSFDGALSPRAHELLDFLRKDH